MRSAVVMMLVLSACQAENGADELSRALSSDEDPFVMVNRLTEEWVADGPREPKVLLLAAERFELLAKDVGESYERKAPTVEEGDDKGIKEAARLGTIKSASMVQANMLKRRARFFSLSTDQMKEYYKAEGRENKEDVLDRYVPELRPGT